MHLALQSPTPVPDLPAQSAAPLRRLPPQTSAVALAAVLSVGAHLLAVALWPSASFSVGSDAAEGPSAAVSGGLVIDLAHPATPAPAPVSAPGPTPAPLPQAVPPQEAGVAVRSDTAPPPEPEALTPPVEAPSPTIEAPRPSAKPAPPAPAPVDVPPQPATSTSSSAPPSPSASAPAPDAGAASASAPPSRLPAAQVRGDQATIPLLRSPRFLSRPAPPAYPSRAVQLGLEGTAVVRALVGGAGTPQEVRLIRSSGFEVLDDAALAAVRTWRFAAAVGVPRAWVELPVRFQLH